MLFLTLVLKWKRFSIKLAVYLEYISVKDYDSYSKLMVSIGLMLQVNFNSFRETANNVLLQLQPLLLTRLREAVLKILTFLAVMAAKALSPPGHMSKNFNFLFFMYRLFHKTFPRSNASVNWMSVRFYETHCIQKLVFDKKIQNIQSIFSPSPYI